jgi:hypothetical protein
MHTFVSHEVPDGLAEEVFLLRIRVEVADHHERGAVVKPSALA